MTFLIWSFGRSIVQWSRTFCAKLVEDTIGYISVTLTCFWVSGSGGNSVKRSFLARALASFSSKVLKRRTEVTESQKKK